MGFAESIRDCFDPAVKMKMTLTPRMITLDNDDYLEIEKLIIEESRSWGRNYDVVYQSDVYSLRIVGETQFSYTDSGGDGYVTPSETLEHYAIKVDYYECRDNDGELAGCDFDPGKLK